MIRTLTLLFWLALGAAQQTSSGSVEGTVLRLGTTEPIEGVQVMLVGALPVPTAVLTGKEGHFSFPSVAPGRYAIRFQRDGYLVPDSAPTMANILYASDYAAYVNVGSGQHVTGLRYSLIRGGTISGRILDPVGRPSVGATVYALRLAYQDGRPTLLAKKSASSNDRGEYRIFWLEPGDYYIRAEKTLPTGAARAYYPGTDNPSTAVTVRVSGGMESPKVDMPIQNVVSAKISGVVTTIVASLSPARPPANVPQDEVERRIQTASQAPQFYLTPIDTDGIYDGEFAVMNALTGTEDRLAGKFEIQSVRAGSYNLIAVLADRSSTPIRYFMGKTVVDIGTQDVSGITVNVVPGRDLYGRVVVSGTSALAPGLRVQLRPKDMPATILGLAAGLVANVAADGTFVIPNVPDLQYSVSVTPLPNDTYIADLRQGSFSVFDVGTIVLGKRANDEFEVILDSPGARINGKVAASAAQLATGAAVALLPDDRRQENLLLYKRATVSETGAFSFTSVAPGRYKLFAWESMPTGAEFNAGFMDAFRDEAREITLGPGDTIAVELGLIPR